MIPGKIIYEQPLNEMVRVCLRLEYLFRQIRHYLKPDLNFDHRTALTLILEALNVVDRPDLRVKFSKTISEHILNLRHLASSPDVDREKLEKVLGELNAVNLTLHQNQGKMGQELRSNDFLFSVNQRINTPGGTAPFSMPAYHLWLSLPAEIRRKDLEIWLGCFSEFEAVVTLLLRLIRESGEFSPQIALNGFYQTNLDPDIPLQMIRIILLVNEKSYPEISVGRHRLSIHFISLNVHDRATQVLHDVNFGLAFLKI